MVRAWWFALLAGIAWSSGVPARAAWRFHWQPGQVLKYRVEHVTSAAEVLEGKKTETTSKLSNIKRWQVLNVDAAGAATLQLSLDSLRIERTTPSGEVLLFDSANPDKSDPQMREQLAKYVGQPLAVLRVDGRGRVVAVKDCQHGPASRFDSELPFVITLPDEGPQAGQSWERVYKITLEPPQGTGEKYDAVQTCACQTLREGTATIALTTSIKELPQSLLDQVPLLQMQPEGGAIFDVHAGRLYRAVLRVDKELKGHQGEGSSYRFQSNYTEQYLGDK